MDPPPPSTPQSPPPPAGAEPAPPPPPVAGSAVPPPAGGVVAATAPTNTMAIVSLVAGIASYVVIPIIGAIVAIFAGHAARRQIKLTGEQGATMAMVGLILGYVHLALMVVIILFFIVIVVIFGAVIATAPSGG